MKICETRFTMWFGKIDIVGWVYFKKTVNKNY